jgi:uncharacterized oxidoreductase
MNLTGNKVLITGGASGIGLAFTERFLQAGNEVIVCGRRESKLQEAKDKHPTLITRVCDVSVETDRIALSKWIKEEHPEVNVLVNNAGIQQRFSVLEADTVNDWAYYNKEISANIEGPFHLSMLFAPFFASKEKKAAIINVSSGLAFTPMAIAPIYSATKAALHSFTISLRLQLADTEVEVIEIAPPAVNTDLGGAGIHTFGAPVNEFADSIFEGLKKEKEEIGYGTSAKALRMSRDEIDEAVKNIYSRVK